MMYTAVHDEFLARAAGGLVAGVVDQHIDAAVSGDDRANGPAEAVRYRSLA
jgi:hypothetical protein